MSHDAGQSRKKSSGAAPIYFSQDEREFKRSREYSGIVPVASAASDMTYLRSTDKMAETRATIGVAVVIIGLIMVVSGFILFSNDNTVFSGGLALVGAVVLLAGLISRLYYCRFDIEDRRYEFVASLLALLQVDMEENATAEIYVNFLPHNHKSKFQRKGKVGYWDANFYNDAWFSMRGRFLDGTKFSMTLLEKQQDRSRSKRSASGKLKTKTKTKNASEVIVSLKFKNKRYPNAQELASGIQQFVRLPQWAELKSVAAEGDALTLRSTTKSGWSAGNPQGKKPAHDGVGWVSMALLSLYKLLNEAK